jgi:hypothetical protein
MRKNVHSRLSTDTKDLRTLIEDIKRGEVKIPQFQRKYVWKEDQALSLLDSIANNYPVGSLLLWKAQTKMLRTERNIGDFNLPEMDDIDPTDYVLDGQQRLTVIYSCLGAAESDRGFAAGYDLEKEEFVRLPKEGSIHIFPLRWTYDMTRLLNFRTALAVHPKAMEMGSRFDGVLRALTTYKIPVVTLKDLTVEEVCPIFERINSSGTKLSTYDLMVASTWSKTFDLNEQTEQIQEALQPKDFQDIEGGTVLKCLAATNEGSIRRKDVFKLKELTGTEMTKLVKSVSGSLLASVDFLSTQFNIHSWDFLPYEALVILLAKVHSVVPKPTPEQIVRLRQWFWRSAFSERYRGASETAISDDISKLHDFVTGVGGKPEQFGLPPVVEVWAEEAFRSSNSRSRAFILALASRKPRNITNGAAIDVSAALSTYNQKQFHHIFPRAHLKRIISPGEHNAVANICMLAASENNQISDKNPLVYLPTCIAQLGDESDAVFASNLLPPPNEFDYSKSGYEKFLKARSKLIQIAVVELCHGKIL